MHETQAATPANPTAAPHTIPAQDTHYSHAAKSAFALTVVALAIALFQRHYAPGTHGVAYVPAVAIAVLLAVTTLACAVAHERKSR